jgi:hypothetical protein
MKRKKSNPLKDPQYLAMKSYNEIFDDMPDGAFFAMAEEMHGWDLMTGYGSLNYRCKSPNY